MEKKRGMVSFLEQRMIKKKRLCLDGRRWGEMGWSDQMPFVSIHIYVYQKKFGKLVSHISKNTFDNLLKKETKERM